MGALNLDDSQLNKQKEDFNAIDIGNYKKVFLSYPSKTKFSAVDLIRKIFYTSLYAAIIEIVDNINGMVLYSEITNSKNTLVNKEFSLMTKSYEFLKMVIPTNLKFFESYKKDIGSLWNELEGIYISFAVLKNSADENDFTEKYGIFVSNLEVYFNGNSIINDSDVQKYLGGLKQQISVLKLDTPQFPVDTPKESSNVELISFEPSKQIEMKMVDSTIIPDLKTHVRDIIIKNMRAFNDGLMSGNNIYTHAGYRQMILGYANKLNKYVEEAQNNNNAKDIANGKRILDLLNGFIRNYNDKLNNLKRDPNAIDSFSKSVISGLDSIIKTSLN